jgi:hypothetical protein
MSRNIMNDSGSDWFLDYVIPTVAFLRDLFLGLGILALIVYFGWRS